jgi:hypothetical protein
MGREGITQGLHTAGPWLDPRRDRSFFFGSVLGLSTSDFERVNNGLARKVFFYIQRNDKVALTLYIPFSQLKVRR